MEECVLNRFSYWNKANILSDIKGYVPISYISSKLSLPKRSTDLRDLLKLFINKGFIKVYIQDPKDNKKYIPIENCKNLKQNEKKFYKIDGKSISWFIIEGYIGSQIRMNFENRMIGIKVGYLGF